MLKFSPKINNMAKNKKPAEIRKFEIQKKAEFAFAYYENAQRVAMVFNLARHFTTIRQDNSTYVVEIYSH